MLVNAIGGEGSKYWTLVSQVLPPTLSAFLDGSVFSPEKELKLGKVVLKALSRIKTDKFQEATQVDEVSETLSKSDVLRANASTQAHPSLL